MLRHDLVFYLHTLVSKTLLKVNIKETLSVGKYLFKVIMKTLEQGT